MYEPESNRAWVILPHSRLRNGGNPNVFQSYPACSHYDHDDDPHQCDLGRDHGSGCVHGDCDHGYCDCVSYHHVSAHVWRQKYPPSSPKVLQQTRPGNRENLFDWTRNNRDATTTSNMHLTHGMEGTQRLTENDRTCTYKAETVPYTKRLGRGEKPWIDCSSISLERPTDTMGNLMVCTSGIAAKSRNNYFAASLLMLIVSHYLSTLFTSCHNASHIYQETPI